MQTSKITAVSAEKAPTKADFDACVSTPQASELVINDKLVNSKF